MCRDDGQAKRRISLFVLIEIGGAGPAHAILPSHYGLLRLSGELPSLFGGMFGVPLSWRMSASKFPVSVVKAE